MRPLALAQAGTTNWLASFAVAQTSLALIDAITVAGAYGLYVGLSGAALVYFWFFLPETAGVALEHMEGTYFTDPYLRLSSKREEADSVNTQKNEPLRSRLSENSSLLSATGTQQA